MKVEINGQSTQLDGVQSLLEVVLQFGASQPFALAVNGDFVPKSEHQAYQLNEGDKVDVLSPIQGG